MNKKTTAIAGSLLTLSTIFACGCGESPSSQGIRYDSRDAGLERKLDTVLILDSSLQYKDRTDKQWKSVIAVEATGSRRSPNDTLEAWAVLGNQINETLQLEVRTSFFDELSSPIGAPSSWTRLFMSENATENYSETSLDFEAYYYLIEVREAR